jgi:hypothetical protein
MAGARCDSLTARLCERAAYGGCRVQAGGPGAENGVAAIRRRDRRHDYHVICPSTKRGFARPRNRSAVRAIRVRRQAPID